jgi:hypothetical protein
MAALYHQSHRHDGMSGGMVRGEMRQSPLPMHAEPLRDDGATAWDRPHAVGRGGPIERDLMEYSRMMQAAGDGGGGRRGGGGDGGGTYGGGDGAYDPGSATGARRGGFDFPAEPPRGGWREAGGGPGMERDASPRGGGGWSEDHHGARTHYAAAPPPVRSGGWRGPHGAEHAAAPPPPARAGWLDARGDAERHDGYGPAAGGAPRHASPPPGHGEPPRAALPAPGVGALPAGAAVGREADLLRKRQYAADLQRQVAQQRAAHGGAPPGARRRAAAGGVRASAGAHPLGPAPRVGIVPGSVAAPAAPSHRTPAKLGRCVPARPRRAGESGQTPREWSVVKRGRRRAQAGVRGGAQAADRRAGPFGLVNFCAAPASL